MEIITTEEVMDKSDIFQARFRKIDKFGWWDLEIISADTGTQIYIHGFPAQMSNSWCSSYVRIYGTSLNERTRRGDIENVNYDCRIDYGTCNYPGSLYLFCINVYGR